MSTGVVVDGDHGHQAVDRDRAGVVGDDQGAAFGGDVLGSAHLDPEPLLGDRTQGGHEEPLGDLGVEAVLVDDVVAGDPTAQEGEELGELRLPLLAEELLGGVLEGREPVRRRDAGPGRAVGVVTAGARRRCRPAPRFGGRRLASAARLLGPGPRSCPVPAAACAGVPSWRAASGRRGSRAAEDGLLPVPRPGRPRVPIGMISASPIGRLPSVPGSASRAAPATAVEGPTGGRRSAATTREVGERLRGGVRRLEPEHLAHPGGVHTATVGQEASCSGEKSATRAERSDEPSCRPRSPASATEGRCSGARLATASGRRRRRR